MNIVKNIERDNWESRPQFKDDQRTDIVYFKTYPEW